MLPIRKMICCPLTESIPISTLSPLTIATRQVPEGVERRIVCSAHDSLSKGIETVRWVCKWVGLRLAICEFEKIYIEKALERNANDLSNTADTLGIHRNTLSKRVAEYDAARKRQRSTAARGAR